VVLVSGSSLPPIAGVNLEGGRPHFANEEIRASYRVTRPSVERIHAQMKRKLNGAKLRYRGVAKHTMHSLLLGAV